MMTSPHLALRRKIRPAVEITVIGAGHGGQAMAGHLAYKGFSVTLYNRSPERVETIRVRGGIFLDGEVRGFGPLRLVTSDMEEALHRAKLIMVVTPATAHGSVAEAAAPFVKDGQIFMLHPGRTGGALEFRQVLKERKVTADVTVAEAQTFIYAARRTGPAQVRIFRIKNTVPLAALPASRTDDVIKAVRHAYPQFIPAENVLKTSMDNIGAVFHPTITLFNAGWIEATHGEFDYYSQGVTPSVALALEAVDRERVAVAHALGVRALTALEWLETAYSAIGADLYEAMQNNEGYKGIKAPPTLRHRYLFEDIPASLVPIVSIGQMLGVPTPTMRAMIHLGCALHGTDYWETGRTVEKLGIAGMSPADIRRLVYEGS
ncbi:MAG: NAD/NADP octopine/nopaline dehydrogenase family protein [Bacillota bacterium]